MLTTKPSKETSGPAAVHASAWRSFNQGIWQDQIDVRDFIQSNYTPYAGDYAFLKGATDRTNKLWDTLSELLAQEREAGGGSMQTPR